MDHPAARTDAKGIYLDQLRLIEQIIASTAGAHGGAAGPAFRRDAALAFPGSHSGRILAVGARSPHSVHLPRWPSSIRQRRRSIPPVAGRPCRLCVLVLASLLLVLPGCSAAPQEATASIRLTKTLLRERFTVGRLAGQKVWQPCATVDSSALVPRTDCARSPQPGTRRFERITDAAQAARREFQSDSSATTLRAGALLDLRWSDASPAGLDRAVESLERARRLAPEDIVVLNDLAVAYLQLGERDQRLMPMLRALDVIENALAQDSTQPSVLFNRALILQRLYLVKSAERAWSRFLMVERHPGWRSEAEAHAHRVAQVDDTVSRRPVPPPVRMDAKARGVVATRVRQAPQAARDSAFSLLREWAAAVAQGNHARADQMLILVRVVSATFEEQNGDQSVGLALGAVTAVRADPERTRRLARAHLEFSQGISLYSRAAYDDAFSILANAARSFRALESPTARWAAFYSAAAEVNRGHYASADTILGGVLAAATPAEPALIGKTIWALGVSQLRRGHYETANKLYRDAARQMARAREPENEGAISYLLTEGLQLTGQAAAGHTEAYRGLRLLAPFRKSFYLNNHLTTVALYARTDGLSHAARVIMDEVLEVAHSTNMPQLVAWALRARVRDQLALGRVAAARRDVADAMRWAARINKGRGRDRVWADVALVQAELMRPTDPRAALSLLTSVVDTYRRLGVGFQVPTAEYQTSLAAHAAGEPEVARTRLERAIEEIETQQASFESAEVRASVNETMESVFDAMIEEELTNGRPASAFEFLERGRVALHSPGRGQKHAAVPRRNRTTIRETVERMPHDMVLVEYALLPNRLVVWTVSRRGWRHHSLKVPRDSVAELVESFLDEADQAEVDSGSARAKLFELLVRPIASELAGARRLAIVPDRDLFRVPFVALWDSARQRYVLEDHQVRTMPSAGFMLAAIAKSSTIGAKPTALVVGNPALDSAYARELPNLPGAENEALGVARLYRQPRVLQNAEGRRGTVLKALPHAAVFHFAGHAVFNGEQPELSFLALAPDRVGDAGVLYAWEIGALRLSNLQMVILSACSSLNPRQSRSGVVAGLAYSFLHAGAPATVSTLWDVNDQTTPELLVEFHHRLTAGTPAAEALRQAQIQALKSQRSEMRPPLAWAGFIYTGP